MYIIKNIISEIQTNNNIIIHLAVLLNLKGPCNLGSFFVKNMEDGEEGMNHCFVVFSQLILDNSSSQRMVNKKGTLKMSSS